MKGTTRKITSQEGGFLTINDSWFPLIKNVLTSLAKSVLIPLGLSEGIPAADKQLKRNLLIRN